MPESPRDKGENPIVDSLAIASEWTIVSKCALHGLIYVWDLKATLKAGEHILKKNSDKVTILDIHKLKVYCLVLKLEHRC